MLSKQWLLDRAEENLFLGHDRSLRNLDSQGLGFQGKVATFLCVVCPGPLEIAFSVGFICGTSFDQIRDAPSFDICKTVVPGRWGVVVVERFLSIPGFKVLNGNGGVGAEQANGKFGAGIVVTVRRFN